jgi:hypothetical protein
MSISDKVVCHINNNTQFARCACDNREAFCCILTYSLTGDYRFSTTPSPGGSGRRARILLIKRIMDGLGRIARMSLEGLSRIP